jgi:alpha-ribazole phosphatase
MEVYLIRHTTPQIKKGICYGQSDVPLCETFAAEAEKVMQHLPSDISVVFSSPLLRCALLAKKISPKQIVLDDRLLELHFGEWEMKEWNAIDQKKLMLWMKDFVAMKVPGGESYFDLHARVNDFITTLMRRNYERVVIVTHAGVIRCFVAKVLKMNLNDTFALSFNYATITKIIFNGDAGGDTLAYLNK